MLFPQESRIVLLSTVLCVVFLSRFLTLGAYPLMDTTESRYAEIAREMVATGDWTTPQLDPGDPFWAKPPLSFWLTALSFKAAGIGEVSARLPSLLLAAFTACLVAVLAARLKGVGFGLICALILSTTGLFYVLAGAVMTDLSLMASVTLSMVGFAMALLATTRRQQRVWGLALFAGLGLSLLAKGPVGWVLTLLPIGLWTYWNQQWSRIRETVPWLSGTLLALAIGLPWHIAAEWKTPGFLRYYVVGEHFQRFFIKNWSGDMYGSPHGHIIGTVWAYGFVGTMPWSLLLCGLVLRRPKPRADARASSSLWFSYVLLRALAPLLFFTVARNIMTTYVLPGVPGFALATGLCLEDRISRMASPKVPWYASRHFLLAMIAFVPLSFSFVGVPILHVASSSRSQKGLVTLFEQDGVDQRADLIYFKEAPYSAQFYSRGHLRVISENDLGTLRAEVDDPDADMFVFLDHDFKRLPDDLAGRFEAVEPWGKYCFQRGRRGRHAEQGSAPRQTVLPGRN